MALGKGKDTLESQMKKLVFENSSLQTENKLIKDKYNRSLARIAELECSLKSATDELNALHINFEGEHNRQTFTAKAEMERQIEQYKAKSLSSSRELDIVKGELAYMEQKMKSTKDEMETLKQSRDSSKMQSFHKKEIEALQGELAQLKQLLKESENNLETECARSKDLCAQVQKINQVRDALQLQIAEGTSGGTVAEKQVASLNLRLKITEERLSQERADRSGNLSQIEEKLLTDNAKLQTKEKELERLLKREKEKTRSLEQRAKDFREQNLQLKLAVPEDDDTLDYELPHTQHAKSRNEYKKPAYDIEQIRKQLEKESGITAAEINEDRTLLYLWEDRQKALHCLKEWKLYLKQMELPEGEDYTQSLQNALALKEEYESKMVRNDENLETIRAEKITSEQVYKQQLSELVRERHEAFAKLQTLEDLMEALRAENESLRQGLATTSGTMEARADMMSSGQTSEILQEEIVSLESRLTQSSRKLKTAENEISSLRSQLKSREHELSEALASVEEFKKSPLSDAGEDALKNQRIETLMKQVADLKEEMHELSERNEALMNEKRKADAENQQIKLQLSNTQKEIVGKQSSAEATQNQRLKNMEEELTEKESEIIKVTSELNETKFLLQRSKEELTFHQQNQLELQNQLKSIQDHVDQRCEMLDSISERENDQLEQIALVKGMMDSLSHGLEQKQTQVDMLTVQLQQASERAARLERQRAAMDPQSQSGVNEPFITALNHSPASSSLRVREMEVEQDNLSAQILDTMNFSMRLQEECTATKSELAKVKEESFNAQSTSMEATNEKNLLERRFQTLTEETEMTAQERDLYKQEAANAELSLCEVVQKFEMEGRKKYANFSTDYADDSPEGQKLVGELQTLRLLTFAKEKENSLILDKISHQEQEKLNLDRKYDLVKKENDQSRQDIQRITKELVLKMKENMATVGLNRSLADDQGKLHKKLEVVENQLQREKDKTQKWKSETNEVFKKIDDSEQTHMSLNHTLQQKDSVIASLELRIGQLSTELKQAEQLQNELQFKSEKLSEDVRNLSNVNTTLESKIENKDSSVKEEQNKNSQQQEKLSSVSQKLEAIKHEQNLLLNNLTTERKTQEKLKDEIKAQEENERRLKEKLAEMTKELEMTRGQLVAANENVKQIKDQKDIILKDYQDSCRRLGEKEAKLLEATKQNQEEIIQVKQQTLLQSKNMEMERTNSEKDMQFIKLELDKMELVLQENRSQLSMAEETRKELEDNKRQVTDLQAHIKEQNQVASESKLLLESLRKELFSVNEENSRLQDVIARKEVSVLDLKDQLRSSGESTETQVTDLKHTIEGMRSHHEYEKKTLREALNKVEDNLKSSVQEVRTLMEARDQLSEQNRTQERTNTDINYKLSHEVSSRKLVEEKLEQMKANVDEMKKKKILMEEKAGLANVSQKKFETDNGLLRERCKTLTGQVKDLECALTASENTVKIRDEKVGGLKNEILRHQQAQETLKQQTSNRVRKLNLDLKQQIEGLERDNVKANHQCVQLTESLEQAREHLASKNKDNLKLQEKMLELQEEIKDLMLKLKQSQDSLRQEEEMQTKLHTRFEEQESELKKLRQFLDKKANEDGDGKTMWEEMNRVISELSRQLSFHIETSRLVDEGSKDNSNLVRQLQRSLLETEGQLNTERTLHQVTRASLQALEEDCSRLRQTLYSMRRRGTRSEKKSKSRMEEINEIIARSQTRAQALLASGEFTLDDSFRNHPDHDANFSPNASITSETSFSSSTAGNLSFLNLAGMPLYSPKK